MAIDNWRVGGPALISVGTGSGGALEVLGYTDGGVDWGLAKHLEPIISDVFGPRTPHTMQDLGEVGRLTLPLIACDAAVLAKMESRGDRTALGQLNTPGLVLTSYAFRVVVAAPLNADMVRSFNLCLVEDVKGKNATKANPLVLSLVSGPFAAYTVTSGKDTQIWTKAAT